MPTPYRRRRRNDTCLFVVGKKVLMTMLLSLVLSSSPIKMTWAFQPSVITRSSTTRRVMMNRPFGRISNNPCCSHYRIGADSALFSSSAQTPKSPSSSSSAKPQQQQQQQQQPQVPLYQCEGLLSVIKPLDWTSNDVVSFIRKMLEREARERGAKPVRVGSRRNKSRIIKVGHGGTLDPLATGVLVVGVGKGTKELQSYLSGSKRYIAHGEFGFETTTLDMDPKGNITQRASFEHISEDDMVNVLPSFMGTIQQVPPIFSAIRKGGKRLYEQAREGVSQEDIQIDAREVVVHSLKLLHMDGSKFSLDMECGGGTYVRSLIRDIAYELNSVATMTSLERTKQGQFTLENALTREDWSPENIYAAIDKCNAAREAQAETG